MKDFSPIDFHHGETLLRVAGHYPTLAEVIFEAVQNCIDAEAKRIWIKLNHKKRELVISDDGIGTSKSKFEQALTSVCSSVKDASKLGQFGMGLIAPLGKCEVFTFTSTPKSNPRDYTRWTFNTDAIRGQSKIHGIPTESLTNLHFERTGSRDGGVPWRTEVSITKFTKDRILSRVTTASLRDGILERYSAAMRRSNIEVEVITTSIEGVTERDTIKADAFTGKRLQAWDATHQGCGRTSFRMYIANKTGSGRSGKVSIGESYKDFRISFASFAKTVGDFLDKDVIDALNSGIFEGEILSERATLDPTRRFFQRNDALLDLCIVIDEWYHKIGEQYVTKIREEHQDSRYQQLGLRSMKVIEEMLSLGEFSYLQEVVKSFPIGTTGDGHTNPQAKRVGLQTNVSLSTQGSERSTSTDVSAHPPSEKPVERKEHIPYSVAGPKGRQRMMVKGNSSGLQFLYEEMEGSSKLWELDGRVGILRFNTRHPLWARCESDDKTLMRFQEHIALSALSIEALATVDWKERHRSIFDDSLPMFVYWLLKGDELSGRKPGAALLKYTKSKKAKAG